MVTGRVPWLGSDGAELQRRVLSEPLSFPARYQPSRPLRHLLSRMLDKNPETRITLQGIKENEWITCNGTDPLPSEQENCRLVEVTEEDVARVVTSIPNLSTLILIKTMLKKHSFQNPFLRSREGSTSRRESMSTRGENSTEVEKTRRGTLARAGRSLSAPGNYLTERQASFDIGLESVQESRDQSQDIISPKGNTETTPIPPATASTPTTLLSTAPTTTLTSSTTTLTSPTTTLMSSTTTLTSPTTTLMSSTTALAPSTTTLMSSTTTLTPLTTASILSMTVSTSTTTSTSPIIASSQSTALISSTTASTSLPIVSLSSTTVTTDKAVIKNQDGGKHVTSGR